MAVLDTAGPPTAINVLFFDSRRHHESESSLLGISSEFGFGDLPDFGVQKPME
jgi:hypothetical protein